MRYSLVTCTVNRNMLSVLHCSTVCVDAILYVHLYQNAKSFIVVKYHEVVFCGFEFQRSFIYSTNDKNIELSQLDHTLLMLPLF